MEMEIKISGKVLLIIILLIVIGIVAWSSTGYFVKDESEGSDLTDLDKFVRAQLFVWEECLQQVPKYFYMSKQTESRC